MWGVGGEFSFIAWATIGACARALLTYYLKHELHGQEGGRVLKEGAEWGAGDRPLPPSGLQQHEKQPSCQQGKLSILVSCRQFLSRFWSRFGSTCRLWSASFSSGQLLSAPISFVQLQSASFCFSLASVTCCQFLSASSSQYNACLLLTTPVK